MSLSCNSRVGRTDMSAGVEQQKLVNAHFQSHVARWREMYEEVGVEGAIYRERLTVVLRWADELAMPLGEHILEIGCGAGMSVVALAQRGYCVEAVDSVPEMLDSTRLSAAGAGVSSSVSTSLGDAHSLAFPDGAFGLVLAIGVMPYLHSPRKALGEMARVLRPGGFLLVTAANRSRLNHVLDPWLCAALAPVRGVVRAILRRVCRRRTEPITPSLRLGSLRELEGWLSAVGLAKVKATTVGFLPLTFHCRPVLGERTSIRMNRWLQRLADHNVPGIKSSGMDYIVLAQKREDF
jgi:ubiquinone/menaquinone biosynthesis C-methylase UbiE